MTEDGKAGGDKGARQRGVSSNIRVTLLISAYFVPLGIFLPFYPVWLEDVRGYSPETIGTILALSTLGRVFIGPLMAAWQENVGSRVAIVSGAVVVAGSCALMMGPESVLIIGLLAILWQSVHAALGPLTESLVITATRNARRFTFGVARGFGSMSFSVGSIIAGVLVSRIGPEAVVPGLLVASLGLLLAAATLLHRREPGDGTPRPNSFANLAEGFGLFRSRRLLIITIAVALTQASHAHYYNFSSIVWLGQGISGDVISLFWTTGVLGEIALLAVAIQMFRRWSPEQIVLLGAAGGLVRWSVLAFAPDVALVVPVQALHSATFAATHLGMLKAVTLLVPDRKMPLALAIYSSFAFGPAIALMSYFSGLVADAYELLGPHGVARGYWLMVGLCVGSASLMLWRLRQPPQSAGEGGETVPAS